MVVNMITFAICDDDPRMARELGRQLANYMEEHSIAAYSVRVFLDGRALLESGGGFDVMFLDIQMEWKPPGFCASGAVTVCWCL